MKTFNEVLNTYAEKYDLNKPLKRLTKAIVIVNLCKYYDDAATELKLKKCDNLTQMINVIKQRHESDLIKKRPSKQLNQFNKEINKLMILTGSSKK
jgi:hypothetical protein